MSQSGSPALAEGFTENIIVMIFGLPNIGQAQ